MAITTSHEMSYRPDIDGLRAFAVVAVMIHHFAPVSLPAGYLGVDVFFVLSGYVICAALYRSRAGGLGEFLIEFYARRAKRLLPALMLCVLATSVAISLFNPAPAASLMTGLMSLVGLSNLHLLSEATDYFGAPAQLDPFTHTWSLGVEEQFYLLLPLVLWMLDLGKQRRQSAGVLVGLLGLTALLSLGLFLVLGGTRNPVSFFLMPARFWELAAGVLAWLLIFRCGFRVPYLSPVFAALLLASLLALMFVPVEFAIAATVGVVLLSVALLVLPTSTPASALLTHPLSAYLGRISYSLYLWHWPVLVLGRWTIGAEGWTTALLLLVTLVIAMMSYHWVESPLRYRSWARGGSGTLAKAALMLFLGCGSLGALLALPAGSLYAGRAPVLQATGVESLSRPYTVPGTAYRWAGTPCVIASASDIGRRIPFEDCTLGGDQQDRPRLLVLGDSFSVALVASFDQLVVARGHSVTLVAAWGAAPVPAGMTTPARRAGSDYYWSAVVPAAVERLQAGDQVLLINDLAAFSPLLPSHSSEQQLADLERGLAMFAQALADKGIELSVLFGVPLAREANCEPAAAKTQWFMLRSPCSFLEREVTLSRRSALERSLLRLQSRGLVSVIDVFDDLCPGRVCSYEHPSGIMLYRDSYSHLSIEAARLVAPRLEAALQRQAGGNRVLAPPPAIAPHRSELRAISPDAGQ